jgi:hypothetical protein
MVDYTLKRIGNILILSIDNMEDIRRLLSPGIVYTTYVWEYNVYVTFEYDSHPQIIKLDNCLTCVELKSEAEAQRYRGAVDEAFKRLNSWWDSRCGR